MLRRTAALATAGALALGGVALLVPTSASATQDSAAKAGAELDKGNGAKLLKPKERRELRETGHTTVTRETKKHGTVTVQVQRGDVTAVSPTSITLKSKDGFTHTYAVTPKTKVKAELSDVKVGTRAQVIAVEDQAHRVRLLKAS